VKWFSCLIDEDTEVQRGHTAVSHAVEFESKSVYSRASVFNHYTHCLPVNERKTLKMVTISFPHYSTEAKS
jgi:hypothetical protein